MKKFIAVLLLLLVCLLSLSAMPQVKPRVWEYKFEILVNEKRANQLGAEGWELAAIDSTSTAGGTGYVSTYVFKRPK